MRIGFQLDQLRPSRGGAETYVCLLANRLLADGHQVHVFTGLAYDEPAGIHLHLLRPYSAMASAQAAATTPLDIVVGISKCLGMNVFQPQGGTFIRSRQQVLALSRNHLLRRARAFLNRVLPKRRTATRLERMQYRQTSPRPHFVAVSHMIRHEMQKYYHVPAERCHVVYNCVDPKQFSPELCLSYRGLARKAWKIPATATCYLLVAHNYRRKGLRELVEAADLLRRAGHDFRLLIVGKDNPWKYKAIAAHLGCRDRLIFAGSRRDIERAYAAADVCVLPTWYDACSLTILEAWACGLPVITTRLNGVSELMTSGQEGLLIDTPADVETLAYTMAELMDAERRQRMGRHGRALAEQFTIERNYREMLAVFELAAAEKRRKAA